MFDVTKQYVDHIMKSLGIEGNDEFKEKVDEFVSRFSDVSYGVRNFLEDVMKLECEYMYELVCVVASALAVEDVVNNCEDERVREVNSLMEEISSEVRDEIGNVQFGGDESKLREIMRVFRELGKDSMDEALKADFILGYGGTMLAMKELGMYFTLKLAGMAREALKEFGLL
jgi:hypothetical protein